MKEKMLNLLKNNYGKLVFGVILFALPVLFFLNVGGIADNIKNNYYKWRISSNFKDYVNKNNFKLFDNNFKFKDKLSNDFIVNSIKNNQCKNLFEKKSTEFGLYAYKINKCFNSGDFYVFDGKLLILENTVNSGENTIYSIDRWINYNLVNYKQGKLIYVGSGNTFYTLDTERYKFIKNIGNSFYILSENNRKKLFYLNKKKESNNLIDLIDLEKNVDKVYFYKSGAVYEISLKYKNSTRGIKIIFNSTLGKVEKKLDLQYMACDKKTQKCWDDFAKKIKNLQFEDIVGGKILKGTFETGAIDSIQIILSGGNCIHKIYQVTGDLLTGVNYKFPIKITGTGDCTILPVKIILKGKNGINYVKNNKIEGYFIVKEFNKNIKILSYRKGYSYDYGLYYTSGYGINDKNPYLIKVVRNSETLDYKYFPKINVYGTGSKYIIGMIYSGDDYGTIIKFDAKNLSKETEKVDKKYFRCDEKTNRCYNDLKDKIISLGVKNLVNKALVSGIFKAGTIRTASIILSGCINQTYQVTGNLYSGINYTFPIQVEPSSKCREIKGVINLTGINNILYSKKFELKPLFLVESMGKRLYKLWDGNNIVLVYAENDLRKNIKLNSLKDNSKIYLYVTGSIYHIGITYSGTNVGRIIEFDTKNKKIIKNEKANYIVCDKKTNWCYDQFKDIVDDIVINKNSFGGTIIGILKEGKVKKVTVQPIEDEDCNLDTEPYELKKFYPGSIYFKYNFALKYKNICQHGGKFKIVLEGFDGKKYETVVSVNGNFYDDRYKPEKFVLLKKVCKSGDKWWWDNNYGFSTYFACYFGYFITKLGKIGIYQIDDEGMGGSLFNLTTNINISNNKDNYWTNNLAYTLINTYFNINKYNGLVLYYDNNDYEVDENFEFKNLDDSFDIINYSGFNFYKQLNNFYIKAPTQNVLLPVNINLGCKGPFCEDLTKFDWIKADDPDLVKHKWKDILIYEKKGKYYILDKKLENGKYLMPVYIDLDGIFDGMINIGGVIYDIIGVTNQLDKKYKYVKTVQIEKGRYKIYQNNGDYYIDGGTGFLQNFVIKLGLSSSSNDDGIIKFNKENFDHAGNYTIWPDNYNEYNIIVEDNINTKDLEQIGTWLKNPVYRIKNSNNEILKQFYCNRYSEYDENGKPTCNINTEKYKTFVANDPILIWKDPLGRYIRMTDIQYVPQAEKAKPVIYLYPQNIKNISVKIGLNGQFLTTIPKYKNGWNVIAYSDGTIVSNGKTYPYLYRDGIDKNYIPPKKGFVIKNNKKEIKLFLQKVLIKIGLNQKEKQDFIDYWLPILSKVKGKYIFIGFKLTESLEKETPLFINPKPDSLLRIFMDYHGLYKMKQVKHPIIKKFIRKGFTVVEWGGRKY